MHGAAYLAHVAVPAGSCGWQPVIPESYRFEPYEIRNPTIAAGFQDVLNLPLTKISLYPMDVWHVPLGHNNDVALLLIGFNIFQKPTVFRRRWWIEPVLSFIIVTLTLWLSNHPVCEIEDPKRPGVGSEHFLAFKAFVIPVTSFRWFMNIGWSFLFVIRL